ncbi:MAG: hypothetical protein GEU98_02930 [Pseudonocardiaceae bacterium]|nr:hypothetical protein [Pseudonocardiaceae bacterium]
MLIPAPVLRAIAEGRVDLAFRRWRRPTVRSGGTLRTAVGVLAIDAVDAVRPEDVTDAQARRAGHRDRAELMSVLAAREGTLYRIRLRLAGWDDPRAALREDVPGPDELDAVRDRLARMDARSSHGPWTSTVLGLIAEHPGVRAAELAARLDRPVPKFKADVRKLKELGLTESLEVGYRLSPRGRAVYRHS